MDYFYKSTKSGLFRVKALKVFIFKEGKIVLHQGSNGFIRASDLETSIFLCEQKSITEAEKESKKVLKKAINKSFDFESYPKINHPKVIEMFSLILDLKNDYDRINGTKNKTFKITF